MCPQSWSGLHADTAALQAGLNFAGVPAEAGAQANVNTEAASVRHKAAANILVIFPSPFFFPAAALSLKAMSRLKLTQVSKQAQYTPAPYLRNASHVSIRTICEGRVKQFICKNKRLAKRPLPSKQG
jgi:hypothetical protein